MRRNPQEGVKRDLWLMTQAIQEHGSDDLDQDGFIQQLATWLEHPQEDPQALQNVIMSQEHQAHAGLASANTEGLRGVFRSLRQKDIPWQRPFQDLPLWERLQARRDQ